jgi:hypothetical protein
MFLLPLTMALLLLGAADTNVEESGYRYELSGRSIRAVGQDGASSEVAVPCEGRALAVAEERLYVACGGEGVAVFSVQKPGTLSLLGIRDLGAEVSGFHSVNGQLWVELIRTEARPLLAAPPQTAPEIALKPALTSAAVPTPKRAATPAVGRVVELRPGTVVIDLGAGQGLNRSDRVALYVEREVMLAAGAAVEQEMLAIGEVTVISEHSAQVQLGRNERVPLNAFAKATLAPVTGSIQAPPRVGGVWEIGFHFRPFLALDSVGLGMVSDAWVGRRLEDNIHIQALLEPFGLGFAKAGNVVATAGNGIISYDTRMLEIGLGAGWSAANNVDIENPVGAADGSGSYTPNADFVRSGFSLAQLARLGSRDGLHIEARNTFLYVKDAFRYGGTVGELTVPASERSWVFARGGGGDAGFAFGELGLKTLLHGNGDRGSVFLSATLGGAGVFGDKKTSCQVYDPQSGQQVQGTCRESVDYSGPMVGFGMEWRL